MKFITKHTVLLGLLFTFFNTSTTNQAALSCPSSYVLTRAKDLALMVISAVISSKLAIAALETLADTAEIEEREQFIHAIYDASYLASIVYYFTYHPPNSTLYYLHNTLSLPLFSLAAGSFSICNQKLQHYKWALTQSVYERFSF